MSDAEEGGAPNEHAVPASIRLSEIELPFQFVERDERLQALDSILQEYYFHIRMMRERWGLNEGFVILLGIIAMILGSWDLGIGELSGGGDFRRFGLFGGGENGSGILYVSDFSLMLALLALISWAGVLVGLWVRYPIMRENLVYMAISSFAIQLGYIYSHSNASTFPFDAGTNDWAGVGMGNLILLFLSMVVVHRAVIETRDIHVQERHMHPDPRTVQKAWRDHSLKAWSLSLGTWMILINISAWAGAHSVALRPPIEQDMTLFVAIHVLSGILAIAFWTHILWYPEFMLGKAGDRIQSVRAREVAGDGMPQPKSSAQGLCPICNIETAAIKNSDGTYEIPCNSLDCKGRGRPGTPCNICEVVFPTRISCSKCGSSTTVISHFTRADAW
ncbi:MAG TPA: hypothetical protein QF529_02885 [Candidatus Thalassarchaeaceae archaeon]|nr:hypothetical protein [Candidatus Thalassarchaeaceae archaeon]